MTPDELTSTPILGMKWIQIYDEPTPVESLNNVIYSRNPRRTEALDGITYILKGPEPEVVAAEALGYRLASLAGIPVPPCAFCRHPQTGDVLFASEQMSHRGDVTVLIENGLAENPDIITDCFAFDVWAANVDRNIGGYVAEVTDARSLRARIFSIDFERCALLAGVSGIMINAWAPRQLKTSDVAVARSCFRRRFPSSACARISDLTASQIQAVYDEVASDLTAASIPRYDSAPSFLHSRGQRLAMIAREVWDA